jgi:hypothetical protein
MKRLGFAGATLAVAFLAGVSSAWASPSVLCVKNVANGAVKGPTTIGGTTCAAGYNKIELPSAAELQVLDKVMPHIKYEETGVGGKPTIQFSGVNVQILNGEGKTATKNGAGNLVIGYDEHEAAREQTGSHDLILGIEQTFTSYGGILGGYENALTGPYASVSGGSGNTASGAGASVSGGFKNTASGQRTWVGGVGDNAAEAPGSAVFGGLGLKVNGTDEGCGGTPTVVC